MSKKILANIHAEWPDVMPRPEWRITAAYLLAAGLWVVLSDYLVCSVWPDGSAWVQALKGLNFIATTSLLLFFVLRRAYRGWRRAERRNRNLVVEMSDCFRQLSGRSERLREEERTRLSRELHDQLGQSLTVLALDLRWMEGRLEKLNDAAPVNPLIDRLVDMEGQVQQLLAAVQSISADLRPDALDRLGLHDALIQEAKRLQQRSGIAITVDVTGVPERLPQEIATTAYRIFQEAMTNVIRHAEASEVVVCCGTHQGRLRLSITDDGVGMKPDGDRGRGALGLLGMRERAESCGGSLRVTSNPDKGTEVVAELPCKRE
ncbi:sensor histidine kinase [Luteolibacter flavescens]|uniref:Sensor histidine kinase n=1 Tax=Luteolibacter flavescens TaxID=1859460 RepID=A0ABT3FR55_9BACT|nr:sensor histidine kinase [Luteolibacter flavescens]MCW1885937.1 sensor histidine kinase [Luteolibacter flavescens]